MMKSYLGGAMRADASSRDERGVAVSGASAPVVFGIMVATGGRSAVTDLDYSRFQALTFDCYGTLIDWETGILAALRPILGRRGVEPPDDELLARFASAEAAAEAGPYERYREILGLVLDGITSSFGFEPEASERATFGGSVADWPAFPDSAAALARLHERFRLGVITNCDDDLFAHSAERLATRFDWVVTAQQAGGYKPDAHNFEFAFEKSGLPRERFLHVAQSLYHDHVPAKRLGLTTVWIDRRAGRPGSGATPAAAEVTPDATFPDMASFAAAATLDP
jgi:2-haloacid dehalogenase